MDFMLLFGLALAGFSVFYGIPDMARDYKMYLDLLFHDDRYWWDHFCDLDQYLL